MVLNNEGTKTYERFKNTEVKEDPKIQIHRLIFCANYYRDFPGVDIKSSNFVTQVFSDAILRLLDNEVDVFVFNEDIYSIRERVDSRNKEELNVWDMTKLQEFIKED